MKLEPRGKYAGVKVHLDGEECKDILNHFPLGVAAPALSHYVKLGRLITKLLREHPHLMEDRTDEQIKEALEYEQRRAAEKLQRIEEGLQWNKEK